MADYTPQITDSLAAMVRLWEKVIVSFPPLANEAAFLEAKELLKKIGYPDDATIDSMADTMACLLDESQHETWED